MADPAWEAYHGQVQMTATSALLEAGATSCSQTLAMGTCPAGAHSVLPTYTLPTGKNVKNIEEAPEPPADGSAVKSAWEQAGTNVSVELKFVKPVVPEWTPPPKPPCSLAQLIPARDVKKKEESVEATESFKAVVQQMAGVLNDMCLEKMNGAAGRGSGNGTRPAHHHALNQDLVRSGHYLQLHESLKKAAVQVLLEKFR